MRAYLRVEKGWIQGFRESEEIPLDVDLTVIGRPHPHTCNTTDTPNVRVSDDFVSQEHLRIFYSYDGGSFLLQERDSGSTNGTFLNGRRLVPGTEYALKDGDIIGLARVRGAFRVIFRFRGSEDTLPGNIAYLQPATKGVKVDLDARRVWADGREVPLSRKQFDLLAFLYINQGKACSKDRIAEKVWEEERGIVTEETIEQTVHRIRNALEPDRSFPRYVRTVHGGYRLDL